VAVALAEQSPDLVARIVIIDTSSSPEEESDLGALPNLPFLPVIGPALWRVKPDASVEEGLSVAFAPGFDVPDEFVDDVKRMNYAAYNGSHDGFDEYIAEKSLAERVADTGKPLLVIMGAEEEIVADPEVAIENYQAAVPTAFGNVIDGVGHSPNVEEPDLTADLILGFVAPPKLAQEAESRRGMQQHMQDRHGVRAGT
jgi:pimeloyl-ACP methyl ester carboxylesterase